MRLGVALLEKLRSAADPDFPHLSAVDPERFRPRLAWTDQGALEIRLNGRPTHGLWRIWPAPCLRPP